MYTVNYNYGAAPWWDLLMGTAYPEAELKRALRNLRKAASGGLTKNKTEPIAGSPRALMSAREREARLQAALVGASYDDDDDDNCGDVGTAANKED